MVMRDSIVEGEMEGYEVYLVALVEWYSRSAEIW